MYHCFKFHQKSPSILITNLGFTLVGFILPNYCNCFKDSDFVDFHQSLWLQLGPYMSHHSIQISIYHLTLTKRYNMSFCHSLPVNHFNLYARILLKIFIVVFKRDRPPHSFMVVIHHQICICHLNSIERYNMNFFVVNHLNFLCQTFAEIFLSCHSHGGLSNSGC